VLLAALRALGDAPARSLTKPRHDILAISGNLNRLDFQRGTRI
jgi:hypothetical protein